MHFLWLIHSLSITPTQPEASFFTSHSFTYSSPLSTSSSPYSAAIIFIPVPAIVFVLVFVLPLPPKLNLNVTLSICRPFVFLSFFLTRSLDVCFCCFMSLLSYYPLTIYTFCFLHLIHPPFGWSARSSMYRRMRCPSKAASKNKTFSGSLHVGPAHTRIVTWCEY